MQALEKLFVENGYITAEYLDTKSKQSNPVNVWELGQIVSKGYPDKFIWMHGSAGGPTRTVIFTTTEFIPNSITDSPDEKLSIKTRTVAANAARFFLKFRKNSPDPSMDAALCAGRLSYILGKYKDLVPTGEVAALCIDATGYEDDADKNCYWICIHHSLPFPNPNRICGE